MKGRRWYRMYLVAIGYDCGAILWFAVSGRLRWFIAIALFFAYLNWRYYLSSKRKWIARRDKAFSFFAEAIAAVPEFAKRGGNYMTLEADGFYQRMEWHDDGWVITASRP